MKNTKNLKLCKPKARPHASLARTSPSFCCGGESELDILHQNAFSPLPLSADKSFMCGFLCTKQGEPVQAEMKLF